MSVHVDYKASAQDEADARLPPAPFPPRVVLFTNDSRCDGCGQPFPARIAISSDPPEAIGSCSLVLLIRCRCGTTQPVAIPPK